MQLLNLDSHLFEVLPLAAISNPLAISFGAIAGVLSRYYLTLWFAQCFGTNFPYGTFAINISGALGIGFFTSLGLKQAIAAIDLRLMIIVGFFGSYTTFSTYALDTATLLRIGNRRVAVVYWAGSAILGILSLELGRFLGKILL